MTLVIDTGPLVALADADERHREAILNALRADSGSLIVPAPVTAEIDYLLGQRFGSAARRAFFSDLAAGRFATACLERDDYAMIAELDDRYRDLDLGLADCSLVVVADRYETDRILSFDERHLRTVTPLSGGTFTILPADA